MNIPDEALKAWRVPDELKKLFVETRLHWIQRGATDDLATFRALAAVLERHEQMVLERKARDLEKYLTGNSPDWDRAINQAIRDLLAPSEPPQIASGGADE